LAPLLLKLVLLLVVTAEEGSCRAPTKQSRAGKHSVAVLEPHPRQADVPKHWGMQRSHQEEVTYSKIYPEPR